MSGIQAKTVAKYVMLPGILPRFKHIFTSGFGYLAFLMAQIYASVRLLPAAHPYLITANIGQFGIRHVIAEAANNLIIDKKNIDQIVIFGLLLLTIVLLLLQIAVLLFTVLTGVAVAGPTTDFTRIFVTEDPTLDVAFILLDQVFGVPDFFNSCVAQGIECRFGTGPAMEAAPFPWPFHIALHQMFRFYSLGILVIAALIFLYFVVVVVAETATSGTPFGQRFQNIWVPIRLIVAIGLIVPLNYGYNAGQYLTFFSAKVGSSLATNAWLSYNDAISSHASFNTGGAGGSSIGANPLGERETLVAYPTPPDAAVIAEMMSIVHACYVTHYLTAENITKVGSAEGRTSLPITIPEQQPEDFIGGAPNNGMRIVPYLVKEVEPWMAGGNTAPNMPLTRARNDSAISSACSGSGGGPGGSGTTYEDAHDFYHGGDILIRFGELGSAAEHQKYTGNVIPTCGEITIPIADIRLPTDPGSGPAQCMGAYEVQRYYFSLIRDLWFLEGENETFIDFAGRMATKNLNYGASRDDEINPCMFGCEGPMGANGALPSCPSECLTREPTSRWRTAVTEDLQTDINTRLGLIWQNYNQTLRDAEMEDTTLAGNWANAGTWFPKIAQLNGAFTDAVNNTPQMTKYPAVMEEVRNIRKKSTPYLTGSDQFNPSGKDQTSKGSKDGYSSIEVSQQDAAMLFHRIYTYWNADQKNLTNMGRIITGSSIKDIINMIFGTDSLFDMRERNQHVHPLAQLTALGKGLVNSSIRNVALSTASASLGGIVKAMDQSSGAVADAAAGFMQSTAFIGLSAGLVLFYIIPFLPFVYFFFAVASWVKTIFEAMVGVPLWALAHLRLDGEGLPGEAAANGYFLLLEVMIRPILTIAGLIAAVVIFTAQARILNVIWDLVTYNVGGFNSGTLGATGGDDTIGFGIEALTFKRAAIDEFFFTVLYAIVIYMAATSSFKLIDSIPDNIMRWIGAGVSSFGDINQDPAEGLTQYAALGGITAGQQAVGGIRELGGGLGNAIGRAATPPPTRPPG